MKLVAGIVIGSVVGITLWNTFITMPDMRKRQEYAMKENERCKALMMAYFPDRKDMWGMM